MLLSFITNKNNTAPYKESYLCKDILGAKVNENILRISIYSKINANKIEEGSTSCCSSKVNRRERILHHVELQGVDVEEWRIRII